jgi:hypothetical protein
MKMLSDDVSLNLIKSEEKPRRHLDLDVNDREMLKF